MYALGWELGSGCGFRRGARQSLQLSSLRQPYLLAEEDGPEAKAKGKRKRQGLQPPFLRIQWRTR